MTVDPIEAELGNQPDKAETEHEQAVGDQEVGDYTVWGLQLRGIRKGMNLRELCGPRDIICKRGSPGVLISNLPIFI